MIKYCILFLEVQKMTLRPKNEETSETYTHRPVFQCTQYVSPIHNTYRPVYCKNLHTETLF